MLWPMILLSTPLFSFIFFYTWWMRGKGFGELTRLLWPIRRPRSREPLARDRTTRRPE